VTRGKRGEKYDRPMFALNFLIPPRRYHLSRTRTHGKKGTIRAAYSPDNIYRECQRPIRTCVYTSSYVLRLSIHLDSHYRPLTGRLKYLPAETFASRPIIMIGANSAPLCTCVCVCVSAYASMCYAHSRGTSPLNYAGLF